MSPSVLNKHIYGTNQRWKMNLDECLQMTRRLIVMLITTRQYIDITEKSFETKNKTENILIDL